MLATVFLVIGQYLARNWALVTGHQWHFDWPWIGVTVFAMWFFLVSIASAWHRTVVWNGTAAPWSAGLWAWSRSSLARYLPTPLWMTGSRIYLTVQLGASWRHAILSYGAEMAGSLGGASGVALLALPAWVEVSSRFSVIIAGLVILVALPFIYLASVRLLHYLNLIPKWGFVSLVGWSCLFAIAFLLYGTAHIFVLHSLGVSIPPFNLVIGVSVTAWALGTLNILTPSGLGTREIILVHGLETYVSPPDLIALAVVSRLVVVLAELLLFASIYMLASIRKTGQHSLVGSKTLLKK